MKIEEPICTCGANRDDCVDCMKDRIEELEAQLAECKDSAIDTVRNTFESDAIAAWKAENQRLRDALRKWQNIEMDMMKMSRLNQWAAVRDAQEVTKKLLEET